MSKHALIFSLLLMQRDQEACQGCRRSGRDGGVRVRVPRIRNLWFVLYCLGGTTTPGFCLMRFVPIEQVGSSRQIGHRPGGCGRGRRGVPPAQLLAAADDTYLVRSGGWEQ